MCPATDLPWKLLGSTDPFLPSLLLLPFEAELSVWTLALKDSACFWTVLDTCAQRLDGAGVASSFARLFREARRHLFKLQLVDVWRRLIACSTKFDDSPCFSHVPDHVIYHAADFRTVVQVSCQPVLEHGFRSHSEQCCLAHCVRDVVYFELHFIVSDDGIQAVKPGHHVTEVLRPVKVYDLSAGIVRQNDQT